MRAKTPVKIFLDPDDVYILKLDAVLSKSTVSARVRALIEEHCRKLEATQPRPMFGSNGKVVMGP